MSNYLDPDSDIPAFEYHYRNERRFLGIFDDDRSPAEIEYDAEQAFYEEQEYLQQYRQLGEFE